jgi:hypothetical protein
VICLFSLSIAVVGSEAPYQYKVSLRVVLRGRTNRSNFELSMKILPTADMELF